MFRINDILRTIGKKPKSINIELEDEIDDVAREVPIKSKDSGVDLEALRVKLSSRTIPQLKELSTKKGLILKGQLGKGDYINRLIVHARKNGWED